MCIIMAKPLNVAFPEERYLKNCWDNNPDMGGFMFALDGKVHIYKGFETWETFKKALDKAREKTGDNVPYVLHFRISTQGFDRECCQPFPLSGNMKALKKFHFVSNMGVAHNGIIGLTSDGSKEYSDTMKFITDYLVNIIRSYDWYKDKRTVKLIENLIEGSRISVLDKKGEITLLGKTWIEFGGCYYSNSTYSYKKYVYPAVGYHCPGSLWYEADDDLYYADYWKTKKKSDVVTSNSDKEDDTVYRNKWDWYFNKREGVYNFTDFFCPFTEEDDDSYCDRCSHCAQCGYVCNCKNA